MKNAAAMILVIVILVLVLALAGLAYRILSMRFIPEPVVQTATETAGSGEALSAADTPEYAPDFTVTDENGETVRLSDFLGTPVIINFWASWCGPCKSELGIFDAACQENPDVTFLMVNLTDGVQETEEGVRAFVEENGYTFPVYFDLEGSAVNAYSIYSIPVTVAVSAEGELVSTRVGALRDSILQDMMDRIR